jgi:hypothetical protein
VGEGRELRLREARVASMGPDGIWCSFDRGHPDGAAGGLCSRP